MKRSDRVIEEIVDAYVWWAQECAIAREAFDRARGARGRAASEAINGYLAAIDREERAAQVYGELLRRHGGTVAAVLRAT